jgi:large subunit ribosomal protein L22
MSEEQKRIAEGGAAEPADTADEAADAKQAVAKEAAEEKAEAPKPKRTRRKKAEEAEEPAEPQAAEDEEAPEVEAETEEATEDEAEEKPKRGRRRSSETAAPAKAPVHKKSPAPRAADGTVVVRAQAKYVRHAPRKARLVVDHIRGKSIDEARAILQHTPRAAAVDVLKLLESAVANAENNHELVADELVIRKAYVDEGPTLKRYRPRALGRATRIRKRTSHMTIQLSPKE